MAYSTGGLIIGAILLAPIALFVEGIPQWPETTALLGTIYLGLFPTALATILLVSVINSAGPAFMSMVNRVFTLLSYSRLLHLRTARTLNLNSSTGGTTTSGFGSGRPVARLCLLIGH